mmetsp:Transcript_5445/g.11832  ORF Transcript_5445/g.11832 Transcript_5445/m.11832 type:complete len:81 (-) Transcript_5445:78-320(-)
MDVGSFADDIKKALWGIQAAKIPIANNNAIAAMANRILAAFLLLLPAIAPAGCFRVEAFGLMLFGLASVVDKGRLCLGGR